MRKLTAEKKFMKNLFKIIEKTLLTTKRDKNKTRTMLPVAKFNEYEAER